MPNRHANRVLLDPTSTMSATYGVAFQKQFRQRALPWSTRPCVFIIDRNGVLRYADDYEDRSPLWTPLTLLDDLNEQRSLITALKQHGRFAKAAQSALAPIGPDTASAVPLLVEALDHEQATVRAGAAAALCWIAACGVDATETHWRRV